VAEEIRDDHVQDSIPEIFEAFIIFSHAERGNSRRGTMNQRRAKQIDMAYPKTENILEIGPNLFVCQRHSYALYSI
jgi:hypothetical protein